MALLQAVRGVGCDLRDLSAHGLSKELGPDWATLLAMRGEHVVHDFLGSGEHAHPPPLSALATKLPIPADTSTVTNTVNRRVRGKPPRLREDVLLVPDEVVHLMLVEVPYVGNDGSHLALDIVAELLHVHLVILDYLRREGNGS